MESKIIKKDPASQAKVEIATLNAEDSKPNLASAEQVNPIIEGSISKNNSAFSVPPYLANRLPLPESKPSERGF